MPMITSVAELEALYGQPGDTSILKEVDHIAAPDRAFIEASPFAVRATAGPEGLDCSPRGDVPGFVRVADARTLLLPDRRGNNRVDSLRNIVRDPRVALLFMVPGSGSTLSGPSRRCGERRVRTRGAWPRPQLRPSVGIAVSTMSACRSTARRGREQRP